MMRSLCRRMGKRGVLCWRRGSCVAVVAMFRALNLAPCLVPFLPHFLRKEVLIRTASSSTDVVRYSLTVGAGKRLIAMVSTTVKGGLRLAARPGRT